MRLRPTHPRHSLASRGLRDFGELPLVQEILMSSLRIAYHRQREREEHALAASSIGPAARDIHLEMGRLHAMLAAKWSTHLTVGKF